MFTVNCKSISTRQVLIYNRLLTIGLFFGLQRKATFPSRLRVRLRPLFVVVAALEDPNPDPELSGSSSSSSSRVFQSFPSIMISVVRMLFPVVVVVKAEVSFVKDRLPNESVSRSDEISVVVGGRRP